jgi:putative nucleotidyltransferase with HDIG domain
MEIPEDVKEIMNSLLLHRYDAYIIGGAVRDSIMGIEPNDYDIFTNATGEKIMKIFPDGKIIGGKERQEKILTVIVRGNEVSQYRANGDRTKIGLSLYKHLDTCDFNMNAIAMDINGHIIDPHGGISDIENKVVDAVGNSYQRIREDKLRVFRAVRFSVKYNFRIGTALMSSIKNTDITSLPVERIREEVLKIIMYPNGLYKLQNLRLLTMVIPEFGKNYYLEGGHHHDETVDVHMHNSQNIACGLTDSKALVFACALHDIGKGSSYQDKNDGISFHKHEKVGAIIIRDIMKRMKFSNNDIEYVVTLVQNHLVNYSGTMSDKAYIKLFGKLEAGGVSINDYIIMLYSDHQGNLKNKRVKFGDFMPLDIFNAKYYSLKFSNVPFSIRDLNISGLDIMAVGVPHGPEVGRFLDDLFERVISGELENIFHVLIRYVSDNR